MWTSPNPFYYFRVTLPHSTLSAILFESDRCLFVFLSICHLCHPFYSLVHNNLLSWSCLWHVLMTKKKSLPCTNQCVLLLSFFSIFGRHPLGNMTPKLNRGCVTFIERFVHFLHFYSLCLKHPCPCFQWHA